MTTQSDDKMYKHIKFTGEEEEWKEWSTKTKMIGKRKGWWDALIKDMTHKGVTSLTKAQLDERKLNEEACGYLTLCCTKKAFKIVSSAEEDNAHKMWEVLKKKYESTGTEGYTTLNLDFNNLKLEEEDLPSNWIMELELINNDIGKIKNTYMKDDTQMIAHVLSNLPETYKQVATNLKMKNMTPKNLEDLKDELDLYYKDNVKELKKKDTEEYNNLAFATYNNNFRKFKGTCNYCGKQGHKMADRWQYKGKMSNNGDKNNDCNNNNKNNGYNNQNRYNNYENRGQGRYNHDNKEQNGLDNNNRWNKDEEITCYACGKKGHIARNCPNQNHEMNMFIGCMDVMNDDINEKKERDNNDENEWRSMFESNEDWKAWKRDGIIGTEDILIIECIEEEEVEDELMKQFNDRELDDEEKAAEYMRKLSLRERSKKDHNGEGNKKEKTSSSVKTEDAEKTVYEEAKKAYKNSNVLQGKEGDMCEVSTDVMDVTPMELNEIWLSPKSDLELVRPSWIVIDDTRLKSEQENFKGEESLRSKRSNFDENEREIQIESSQILVKIKQEEDTYQHEVTMTDSENL